MKPSEYLLKAHDAGVQKIEYALYFLNDQDQETGEYCCMGVIGRCTNTPLRETRYGSSFSRSLGDLVDDLPLQDVDLLVLGDVATMEQKAALLDIVPKLRYEVDMDTHARVYDLVVLLNDTPVEDSAASGFGGGRVFLNFREIGHILQSIGL